MQIEATARRDDGMATAICHAESVHTGWSDHAAFILRMFVSGRRAKGCPFLAEEFVAYAKEAGLAEPPDRRAFGAVIRHAAFKGEIEKAGYAEDAYCSPKTLWK